MDVNNLDTHKFENRFEKLSNSI